MTRRIIRRAPCPVLSVGPSRLEQVESSFRAIASTLTLEELARSSGGGDEAGRVLEQLAGQSMAPATAHLLLGRYGDVGLRHAMDRFGVAQLLEARGFTDLRLELKAQDADRDIVRLFSEGVPDVPLVEMVLQLSQMAPEPWMRDAVGPEPLTLLMLEWVLMQNPRAAFSLERPPLPGQMRPGLGIGYEVTEMFVLAALRLGRDGLWSRPQFYHNARLGHERFRFLDPAAEGLMLALERDAGGRSLAEISWAVHLGLASDQQSRRVLTWGSWPQCLPISPRARGPLESLAYRREVRRALQTTSFLMDWDRLPPPGEWQGLNAQMAQRGPEVRS